VEYIDEFGRTRVARKSQVPKIESPIIGYTIILFFLHQVLIVCFNLNLQKFSPTIPDDDNELISEELLQRWEEAAKNELGM
jgi:hypothetical protein